MSRANAGVIEFVFHHNLARQRTLQLGTGSTLRWGENCTI